MDSYLKYLDTDVMNFIKEISKTIPEKGHTFIRNEKKIGRNEYCKCGSNKKYKKCCGK